VHTSKVAGLIDYVNSGHKQDHKNVVLNEDCPWTRSVVDCKEADVRFDGIARSIAVEPRKLLIVLEKGLILMMNLLFDQAELDVADALFTVVKCDSPVLPSSVRHYCLFFSLPCIP